MGTTKHIYINGRFLLSPQTGVERFAYEICKALAAIGVNFTIICPRKGQINEVYNIAPFHIIRFGMGQSHIWEQLVLPLYFINKSSYIIMSFTGLGSIIIPNKIMTIHDLSFLENPKWFSKSYYYYYKVMTPLAVKTSKRIITVSSFSKSEIKRFYPFISSEKISVVPNALSDTFQTSLPQQKANKDCYFLAVSSMDPRKNFARLIHAFESMKDYQLLIVGGKNRVYGNQNNNTNNKNIKFLGRVSDEELINLYANAEAFIYPSLYEGFGIPPLEAMALGCPVLASDIPVLHEVCKEAALYFNPLDEKDIQSCIEAFHHTNDSVKTDLIKKGYNNIKRFSWIESAKEIIKLVQ